MKAKEVLKVLNISRPTLERYIEKEYIFREKKDNDRYVYSRKSVEDFIKKEEENSKRKIIIYISALSQDELEKQIDYFISWSKLKDIKYNKIIKDIGSEFSEREGFMNLLDRVYNGEIKEIIVYEKNIISDDSSLILIEKILERNKCILHTIKTKEEILN